MEPHPTLMKRKYEGVYILKLQGQEETIDEMVGKITKELESNGASLEQIDRLGRKQFVHPNFDKQTHGYYLQYRFEAEPTAIHEVETHLKLNEQVMLQHYRRL
ncbi:MAG: 30S ribosomal protein S6 [Verrucomicrobiia bacterium Tous-C2TDCM]|nr:MAG: 30S ribosomal protein S6 [Verrucomicrobiae bacterium Tous-C2TDCM]